MTTDLLSNQVDAAGRRRVVIQVDGGEPIALKFPAGATVAEMKAEAHRVVAAEVARRQAEGAEATRLRGITDAAGRHMQGLLSAAQKTALLDALAAEWVKR